MTWFSRTPSVTLQWKTLSLFITTQGAFDIRELDCEQPLFFSSDLVKEVHAPASVDDARNEGGANPQEAMMTGMEFIHLPRKQFLTPFCLFILCAAPSLRMLARVTRDGTICAKNSTYGYFDGTNPITGKVSCYCLLPRLWLLVSRIAY